jgi:YD repeat-containing protein
VDLTTDTYTGVGNRVYDAENKMTSAQDNAGVWSYYTYNADGQRTRRKIDNQETWQIYGFDGELMAEYAANAAVGNPQKEYGYRNGQLLITAEIETPRTNLALSSSGATVTASSQYSANYPASSTINGDRRGLNWNNGGGWNDATSSVFPDWLQIDFSGSKTLDEIDIFTLQDNPATPAEPTESMTFSLYGLTSYEAKKSLNES